MCIRGGEALQRSLHIAAELMNVVVHLDVGCSLLGNQVCKVFQVLHRLLVINTDLHQVCEGWLWRHRRNRRLGWTLLTIAITKHLLNQSISGGHRQKMSLLMKVLLIHLPNTKTLRQVKTQRSRDMPEGTL